MARPHPLPTNPYSANGKPFTPIFPRGCPCVDGYVNLYTSRSTSGVCDAGFIWETRSEAQASGDTAKSADGSGGPFARVRVRLKPCAVNERAQ
jgi:hypothetical protein